MRASPLRFLLAIVGAVTILLAALALYLWSSGDENGSLLLATAVATFSPPRRGQPSSGCENHLLDLGISERQNGLLDLLCGRLRSE